MVTTGWIVGTSAPTLYARMASQAERGAVTHTSTVEPSGGPDNALGDCFRTDLLNGTFSAGNWTFNIGCIGETRATSTHDGRFRLRMWRSTNATGSSATEITTSTQVTTAYANLTNTSAQVLDVTFDPGAFTLSNEYLFIQVAHELTGAGSNAGSDTHLRTGNIGNLILTSVWTETAAVADSASIADVLTVFMPGGAPGPVSLTDSASIADVPTVRLPNALIVSVADSASIADAPTVGAPGGGGGGTTPATIVAGGTIGNKAGNLLPMTINTPTYAAGDEIFVFAQTDGDSDTLTIDSSGWTAQYDNIAMVGNVGVVSLWHKTAGSEPSTYTITSTVLERGTCLAWAVRNYGGNHASGTTGIATNITVTSPAVTTTIADTLRITVFGTNRDILTLLPAFTGHTVGLENHGTSAGTTSMQYKALPSAGTDGAVTATMDASGTWVCATFAIAPTAGGGVTTLAINVSDSASVADDLAVLPLVLPSTLLADSAVVADSLVANLPIAVSLADSAAVADALTVAPLVLPAVSLTDSATVAEALSVNPLTSGALAVSVADSASIADALTVSRISIAAIAADSASISEALTVQPLVLPQLSITDSALLADSVVVSFVLQVSLSDSASIAEALTVRAAALSINVTDGATVTDSLIVAPELLPQSILTDSASLSDAIQVQIPVLVSVTDSVTAVESVSLQIGLALSVTDSAAVADALAVAINRAASVDDNASIGEAVTVRIAAALSVSVADSALISETLSATRVSAGQMLINVGDGIAALDAVNALIRLAGVSLADSAGITDALAVVLGASVSVGDVITSTDATAAYIALQTALGDAAGLSEVLSAALILRAALTDSATVIDAVNGSIGVAVSVADSGSIADAVTVTMPGVSALLVNVTDAAAAGDAAVLAVALAGVNVGDSTVVSETLTASTAPLSAQLTDAATIGETLIVAMGASAVLFVDVGETALLSDAANLALGISVSLADVLSTVEATSATIPLLAALSVSLEDVTSVTEVLAPTMQLAGVSVVEVITIAEILIVIAGGITHADWTITNGLQYRWGLADEVVNSWTRGDTHVYQWEVINRSKS